jgi:hypothetical protein
MKVTNKFGLPEGIVNAVTHSREEYTKGKAHISVSGLVMPPRMYSLFVRHNSKIEVDVADEIDALFGSAVHYILERSDVTKSSVVQEQALLTAIQNIIDEDSDEAPEVLNDKKFRAIKAMLSNNNFITEQTKDITTEQRWYMRIGAWIASGQYDRLDVAKKLLEDYKTTSVYKVRNKDFKDWEQRMNLYRLLGAHNGIEITKLQINALMKDWRRSELKRYDDYPPHKLAVIDLPVWDLMDAHQFATERTMLHYKSASLSDEELPFCTDEERWKKPDVFKAIKPGGKKASFVSEDEEEVNKFIVEKGIAGTQYTKTVVRGQALRCEEYCAVAPFCSQYKAESEPETDFDNTIASTIDEDNDKIDKLIEEDPKSIPEKKETAVVEVPKIEVIPKAEKLEEPGDAKKLTLDDVKTKEEPADFDINNFSIDDLLKR